jgi:hypothetical protein
VWVRLSNFKQPSFQHNTSQLLCIYGIPPDDGQQICQKHVEIDGKNNLMTNIYKALFIYTAIPQQLI